MKRVVFGDENQQTFIPIKKGMNPRRQERDEEFARKPKKQPRRDRRNYSFDIGEWQR